jgi:hypothetical protein
VKVLEELQDKKPQKTLHKQERPKRSRNKQRTENNKLRRSEQHLITEHDNQFIVAVEKDSVSMAFMTRKEQADIKLAIKLRKNSVIITLKDLFKRSQQQEIDGLITRGVFEFV